MKRFILFSLFASAVVMTVVSSAQNPPPPEMHLAPAPPVVPPQAPAKGGPGPNKPNVGEFSPQQAPLQQNPNQQAPDASAPRAGDQAVVENGMPVFQNPEGYHYDPTGRRDPFKPFWESQAVKAPETVPTQPEVPAEPLQMFDVSQFKLLGIIWQVKEPKAMVLDPSGRTHIIRKQVKIGRNNGFVAAIREGEVIVVEPSVGENGMQSAVTRTMNLK